MTFSFPPPYFSLPIILVNLGFIFTRHFFRTVQALLEIFLVNFKLDFLSLSVTSGFAPCYKLTVFSFMKTSLVFKD